MVIATQYSLYKQRRFVEKVKVVFYAAHLKKARNVQQEKKRTRKKGARNKHFNINATANS
jgi:hypothetical protein